MASARRWWIGTIGLAVAAAALGVGCTQEGTSSGATAAASTSGPSAPSSAATPQVVARYGEGFLEDEAGRLILHTKGSTYERGVQYGYLLGDKLEALVATLATYASQSAKNVPSWALQLVTPVGSMLYEPYFDADSLEEIRGIIDGARLRDPNTTLQKHDLIFVNSLVDIGGMLDLSVFRCSSLAVWGSRTEGGKLIQTRVIDLMVGSGLENFCLVVMAKPEGGIPYVNVGWVGMIGVCTGMNAAGLGVGQIWAKSTDNAVGRPWPIVTRQVMATGASVDDAVDALRRSPQRTYGSNFVFADPGRTRGGVPAAVAVETTASMIATFGENDPRELQALYNGQPYGIPMTEAVFRGDSSMDPAIRSRQTSSHGPTGDPRTASAYKNRYQGQADAILRREAAGKKIDAAEAIEITKEVAMPKNSLLCAVYANDDLELWVANARLLPGGGVSEALHEPYYHYSLDAYAPTATAVPDSTTLVAGDPLRVALPLETLGRGQTLDLVVRLETAGGTTELGRTAVGLQTRTRTTPILNLTVPAQALAGAGVLSVEVRETATGRLVDLSRVDVTIR